MSKAIKGALLSGLVFPGLGQIALKHYRQGIVQIGITLASLTVIVRVALQQAQMILQQIDQAGGVVDMNTLSKAAADSAVSASSFAANAALVVLLICWVVSIIGAYRLGSKLDSKEPDQH